MVAVVMDPSRQGPLGALLYGTLMKARQILWLSLERALEFTKNAAQVIRDGKENLAVGPMLGVFEQSRIWG